MSAPEVQLLGHAVLIQGPAVRDLLGLARLGLRVHRSDGLSASPRQRALLEALAAALPQGDVRADTADVRESGCAAESFTSGREVDSAAAAQLLGLGVRQVRRLARDLGGRRTAAGWRFEERLVTAYQSEREGELT